MSKKNQRKSNVTINRSTNNGSNVVKIVAIILVAIMALACIFAPKASENGNGNASAKAIVHIDLDGDGKAEAVEVEDITRVFLVDTSGSNQNVNRANSIATSNKYDVIIPFSNFVGEEGGNSYICTCMEMALSMGVKELALYTDMECYPDEDWSAFDGKFYQNREVVIYLADNATAQNVNRFTEIAKTAFDSSNCSVKFVYTDGSEQVVFDAYGKEETTAETESTDGNVDVEVEATANGGEGNNMMLFMVCMALVIALIVMSMKGETIIIVNTDSDDQDDDVPEGTEEVFKDKHAGLDASASVAGYFTTLLYGAEKLGVNEVTVFNDTVKTMTLDEAKKLSASGRTCGWTFLREAAKAGHKDIAIFSDFEFNDTDKEPADGELEFDSITIATPAGKKCDERVIAKICTFAKAEIKKVVINENVKAQNESNDSVSDAHVSK